ncbi:hypothetical protein [Microbacterium album]|uniref:Uncharacterized protein n=1 Tax=Microbacterium album TaxID=2053191 RepID=A0A917MLM6_9MICO|nr:hypothetical protein [Microbacterium album]GGH39118.1 hypothetical protein GCM10010921_10150 [Microbacterium album]
MHNTATAARVPAVPVAAPAIRGRETLLRAGAALWRVVAPDARVLGHLRRVEHPLGERFRAERLHVASGRFIAVGEFWTADEAVAALRS